MTLNGIIALILRFLQNSTALQAVYVTVVEDRPIMSVTYWLPVPVFQFWPKLTHAAARSPCDSGASCYILLYSLLVFCLTFNLFLFANHWLLMSSTNDVMFYPSFVCLFVSNQLLIGSS